MFYGGTARLARDIRHTYVEIVPINRDSTLWLIPLVPLYTCETPVSLFLAQNPDLEIASFRDISSRRDENRLISLVIQSDLFYSTR